MSTVRVILHGSLSIAEHGLTCEGLNPRVTNCKVALISHVVYFEDEKWIG